MFELPDRIDPAGRRAGFDLRTGGRLAQFEIVDELGSGAMGRVWLARDTQLDRLVALKTLVPAHSAAPELEARLVREARTVAALRHPGIIAVHGFGRVEATVWLAMEFAEGGDLAALLRAGPVPVRSAAAMVEKLAAALACAHAAGVLHRDLKPSNILLDERGEPKLADFGLAAPGGGGDLTLTGQVLGTPAYLAPELLQQSPDAAPGAGPAADLYSLGVVLYEMLTGRPPIVGATTASILAALAVQEPIAPRRLRPEVPRDLDTIVLKCLEKNPLRRYADAAALAADLHAFLAGRPIAARPLPRAAHVWRWARREPGLATALAATVILLAAVALIASAAAVRIDRARTVATREADRAQRAEAQTREQLRAALLAQAHATRLTGQVGQRFEALATLQAAARIRPGDDLRAEAIQALTLPDARLLHDFPGARSDPDQALALDPARGRFAVEASPGTWELRSLTDQRVLGQFSGGNAIAESPPAFFADGRYFLARSADEQVRVWAVEAGGAPLLVLHDRRYVLHGKTRFYGAPDVISPDGRLLASALNEGGFTLHELPSGREIARVPTAQTVTHLSFSRDGRRLAIGHGLWGSGKGAGGFLAVAEIDRPETLRALPVAASFNTIDWADDGPRLLYGGQDWTVADAATGSVLFKFRDTAADFGFFGPDGRTALTASKTGGIKLWDLKDGEALLHGAIGNGGTFALTPDRREFIRNHGALALAEYALETSAVQHYFPSVSPAWDNAARYGRLLDFSPDGRWLAQAVWGAVHLRETGSGRVVDSRSLGGVNDLTSALFEPGGAALLVGSEGQGLVRLSLVDDGAGGRKFGPPEVLDPEPGFVVADLSPAGDRVLLLSRQQHPSVKIVALHRATGTTAAMTTMTALAPTALIATAPARWDFPAPTRAVFCDGGATVLVNGLGGMGKLPLELFDAASGRLVRQTGLLQGNELSRSRDGRWLAIGTAHGTSGLWRAADWTPGPALPEEFQGAGKATSFSPDGTVVAIASGAEIALVRLADGVMLARLQAAQSGNYAPDLTFSPDGRQLAVLWRLGQLTLWDLAELHRELAPLGLDW